MLSSMVCTDKVSHLLNMSQLFNLNIEKYTGHTVMAVHAIPILLLTKEMLSCVSTCHSDFGNLKVLAFS